MKLRVCRKGFRCIVKDSVKFHSKSLQLCYFLDSIQYQNAYMFLICYNIVSWVGSFYISMLGVLLVILLPLEMRNVNLDEHVLSIGVNDLWKIEFGFWRICECHVRSNRHHENFSIAIIWYQVISIKYFNGEEPTFL